MKAKRGEWFCLQWDISDYHSKISFEQFNKAPRFLYAEEDSEQIEGSIINVYDRIRLVSVSRVGVFITQDHGLKVPTHYRIGEFMPNDEPRYDKWLSEYHNMNYTISEKIRDKEELQQKKVYLEHTAKIIRHDMHSGINTYIPRGIKGLLKRLPDKAINKYNLHGPLKLLEDGITYTQKVYRGVYALTNLVKEDGTLEKTYCNLKDELESYLKDVAYKDQVFISDLISCHIQPILFCTAIDYLIKGGLQFNDNEVKRIDIYMEDEKLLCIKDNGIGLSKEEFLNYCKPYINLDNSSQIKGVELNVAVAIIMEHGFDIYPEKQESGTIFKINLDTSFREYIIDKNYIKGIYPKNNY